MTHFHSVPDSSVRRPTACVAPTHRTHLYLRRALILVMAVLVLPGLGSAFAQSVPPSQEEDLSEAEKAVRDARAKALSQSQNDASSNSNHLCSINVLEAGNLGISPRSNQLSSKLYGGRAGRVQVEATNSSYSLSISPALGFKTFPSGGADNVAFTASYSANGATNFSQRPGTQSARMKRGVSIVETHLTADRLSDGGFPPGNYNAEIIIRCE